MLIYGMWGIKTISMKSKNMLDGSLAQVLQLPEVDLGEQGQHHGAQSSDEVGHAGYQIDQHEKHNKIKGVTCTSPPTSKS